MNIIAIIIGIFAILAAVAVTIFANGRTPENLKGYYGVTNYFFDAILIAVGIFLIVLGAALM